MSELTVPPLTETRTCNLPTPAWLMSPEEQVLQFLARLLKLDRD
ncbi:MAG: hypothetical protein ABJG78_14755 [Cyclobacteriaceae bacterium]